MAHGGWDVLVGSVMAAKMQLRQNHSGVTTRKGVSDCDIPSEHVAKLLLDFDVGEIVIVDNRRRKLWRTLSCICCWERDLTGVY